MLMRVIYLVKLLVWTILQVMIIFLKAVGFLKLNSYWSERFRKQLWCCQKSSESHWYPYFTVSESCWRWKLFDNFFMNSPAAFGTPLKWHSRLSATLFWLHCEALQESQQEWVNFSIDAVLKSILKYLGKHHKKNLKTRSGPSKSNDLILQNLT